MRLGDRLKAVQPADDESESVIDMLMSAEEDTPEVLDPMAQLRHHHPGERLVVGRRHRVEARHASRLLRAQLGSVAQS